MQRETNLRCRETRHLAEHARPQTHLTAPCPGTGPRGGQGWLPTRLQVRLVALAFGSPMHRETNSGCREPADRLSAGAGAGERGGASPGLAPGPWGAALTHAAARPGLPVAPSCHPGGAAATSGGSRGAPPGPGPDPRSPRPRGRGGRAARRRNRVSAVHPVQLLPWPLESMLGRRRRPTGPDPGRTRRGVQDAGRGGATEEPRQSKTGSPRLQAQPEVPPRARWRHQRRAGALPVRRLPPPPPPPPRMETNQSVAPPSRLGCNQIGQGSSKGAGTPGGEAPPLKSAPVAPRLWLIRAASRWKGVGVFLGILGSWLISVPAFAPFAPQALVHLKCASLDFVCFSPYIIYI